MWWQGWHNTGIAMADLIFIMVPWGMKHMYTDTPQ